MLITITVADKAKAGNATHAWPTEKIFSGGLFPRPHLNIIDYSGGVQFSGVGLRQGQAKIPLRYNETRSSRL